FNRVLPKDETYTYNWQFNLSNGANLFEVTDLTLKDKLAALATTISKTIDLRFGSIDIIETTTGELLVIEANSGVMLEFFIELFPDGYNIAKSIYHDAISKMFS
ncbi:MAG: hypothetical protein K2J20_00360, partial [Bacilli bacterium]|nr:hypothetical protein [Bacilli bacterium]